MWPPGGRYGAAWEAGAARCTGGRGSGLRASWPGPCALPCLSLDSLGLTRQSQLTHFLRFPTPGSSYLSASRWFFKKETFHQPVFVYMIAVTMCIKHLNSFLLIPCPSPLPTLPMSWSPVLLQKVDLPVSCRVSFIWLRIYPSGFSYERNQTPCKLVRLTDFT